MVNKFIYSFFIVIISVIIVFAQLQDKAEQRLVAYHRCLLDIHCQNVSTNSFCFGNDDNKIGLCKCINGYELLSRNRTFFACLKYADFDEPCEKDVQCYYHLSNYAVCDTTCKCSEGAHRYLDGRCYQSIKLGDYCQIDANCLLSDGTFGNCVSGRCECKFDNQLPLEDAMSCAEAKGLGELCNSDNECSFIPNSVCRVSCRCSAGNALSRDGRRCLRAATKFFEECEENVQCSEFLISSLCNNGNCTCLEGYHGYGSKCVKNVEIGGYCTGMEECIPDPQFSDIANCIDNTCQCLPGAVNEQIGCSACRTFYSVSVLIFCLLSIFYN